MADIDIHELRAPRPGQPAGGTAPGAVREGQCPGDRRPGARRPDHGPGREDPRLSRPMPPPCRWPSSPTAPPPVTPSSPWTAAARWPWTHRGWRTGPRSPTTPPPAPAGSNLDGTHPGGDRHLAARGAPAAVRQAPHRARRRPQAPGGHLSTAARPCPRAWTSGTASSTTSARWTRWATRWSAPPVPRPPPAWTSSPSRCWPRPGSSGWSARPSAALRGSRRSSGTGPCTSSPSAGRPIWWPRRSRVTHGRLPGPGDGGDPRVQVEDMPVTVAVDSRGESVHQTGPAQWRGRIGKIPVTLG